PLRYPQALADLGGGTVAGRHGRDGGRYGCGPRRRDHRRRRTVFSGDLMFGDALLTDARDLLAAARERKFRIATAESCTGGLIAALLTEIPGSSDVVERGFVTYSNQAKEDLLDVPADLIHPHGAVSQPVVRALAE